jgi:hypothetical protein
MPVVPEDLAVLYQNDELAFISALYLMARV